MRNHLRQLIGGRKQRTMHAYYYANQDFSGCCNIFNIVVVARLVLLNPESILIVIFSKYYQCYAQTVHFMFIIIIIITISQYWLFAAERAPLQEHLQPD